jgi:hypothetical protein
VSERASFAQEIENRHDGSSKNGFLVVHRDDDVDESLIARLSRNRFSRVSRRINPAHPELVNDTHIVKRAANPRHFQTSTFRFQHFTLSTDLTAPTANLIFLLQCHTCWRIIARFFVTGGIQKDDVEAREPRIISSLA